MLTLHKLAGVQICAVGDPDQSVMGFTGADPRYLDELAGRSDFLDITLDLNYRSGSAIIAASHAALGDTRDHRADPDRSDAGVVEPIAVAGGLADHADTAVREVEALISTGVRPERIAILYPRRGRLLEPWSWPSSLPRSSTSMREINGCRRALSLSSYDGALHDASRGRNIVGTPGLPTRTRLHQQSAS